MKADKNDKGNKILAIIGLLVLAFVVAMVVSGCGGSIESTTTTSVTIIPEPVCAVANNQICAGDSAVFYDNNLNADINYYGDGIEYFYVIDDTAYAANGSIDTFETAPLLSGTYYATLEIVQFDQYGNAVIDATVNCPPVAVYNCD